MPEDLGCLVHSEDASTVRVDILFSEGHLSTREIGDISSLDDRSTVWRSQI